MSNILEYILKLQDQLSPKLKAMGVTTDSTTAKLGGLQRKVTQVEASGKSMFAGFGSMMATVGVGFGMFQVINMMEQGVEKAHELHAAEAQLKNTMLNMGTYSSDSFEKIVSGSKNMAKGILYGTSEVISLQSQLRMIGNIGEHEMQRLTAVSADMATKFNIGLSESGNMLAKAVNNPEMMARLGQRLKIDPAIVDHLQKLAKGGHEAQARLELLNIVEQKVGGAAKAAFNADPLAKYNKTINSMKVVLGESAIKIQAALAPSLIFIATLFGKVIKSVAGVFEYVINRVRRFFELLNEGNPVIIVITAAITGVVTVMAAQAAITGIVSAATAIWTGAQWLLNAALTANPVGLVIAGIIALIAIIAFVAYKTDGWGKQWDSVVNFMKYSFMAYIETVKLYFNTWVNGFLIGLDIIKLGWYKFKEAVGLGDSKENQSAIAKINADVEARQKAIVDGAKKVADLTSKAKDSLKWELSWNSKKSLGDVVTGLKNKIMPATHPGQDGTIDTPLDPKAKVASDAISSGGARNTSIQISFKNMVESIVFDGNLADKRGDLEKEVTSIMARVLGMAQATS